MTTNTQLKATVTQFGFDATQALRHDYDLAILQTDGQIYLITKKPPIAEKLEKGFGVRPQHPDYGPYEFELGKDELGSVVVKLKEFFPGLQIQEPVVKN